MATVDNLPELTSHSLHVLSMEPVAMREQSQLNCALLISALWPTSDWIRLYTNHEMIISIIAMTMTLTTKFMMLLWWYSWKRWRQDYDDDNEDNNNDKAEEKGENNANMMMWETLTACQYIRGLRPVRKEVNTNQNSFQIDNRKTKQKDYIAIKNYSQQKRNSICANNVALVYGQ
jgi:hypothetical protein